MMGELIYSKAPSSNHKPPSTSPSSREPNEGANNPEPLV